MPSKLAVGPISMMIAGSRFGDARHALGELHGVSQMIAPVAGGRRLGHQLAGEIRRERHLRRVILDAGRKLLELVEHLVHQRRMKCVRHVEQLHLHAVGFELRGQLVDRRRVAGDDRVLRAVDHGDDDFAAGDFDFLCDAVARREHDRHLAVPLHVLHEPRPLGDQPQAVFQAHHAGDAGGRVLADAVAEHDIRHARPTTPTTRRARIPARTARAACTAFDAAVVGFVARDRAAGYRIVEQRFAAPAFAQNGVALLERAAKHGLRFVQPAAHADVLRTLPGEQERDVWAAERADRRLA